MDKTIGKTPDNNELLIVRLRMPNLRHDVSSGLLSKILGFPTTTTFNENDIIISPKEIPFFEKRLKHFAGPRIYPIYYSPVSN